jgi:putative transposase
MALRQHNFIDGEIYHIYNRGNSKQTIFHDEQDHNYFINLLRIMNTDKRIASRIVRNVDTEHIIDIGAYCLMPNHFHIVIKQQKEGGIILFMRKVSTAYVMYYNKKYKRTGGLFEGKFKSKYAGEDRYLRYLFSYIHLNPLKIINSNWRQHAKFPTQEMISFLATYSYSSYLEYLYDKERVINRKPFPNYFPSRESFIKDIISWFAVEET